MEAPHSGASYNPSYSDHQDLLWKAAVVEINKEKANRKIEYHTTRLFPSKEEAPTEQAWIKEMSQGIAALKRNEEGEDEEDASEDNAEEEEEPDSEEESKDTSSKKLKTRQQRRKAKERRAEEHRQRHAKTEKKKGADLLRVKSIKKALTAGETLTEARMAKREAMAEAKKVSKNTKSRSVFFFCGGAATFCL